MDPVRGTPAPDAYQVGHGDGANSFAIGQAVGVKVLKTAIELQENLVSTLLEGLGGTLDRSA